MFLIRPNQTASGVDYERMTQRLMLRWAFAGRTPNFAASSCLTKHTCNAQCGGPPIKVGTSFYLEGYLGRRY